jgi:hypothetical protein
MSRPILTSLSEEEASSTGSSDKDVSDATLSARTTFSIVIFLAGSVRRDKRQIFYQSKADTAPPCSHGPLTEE